MKHWNIIVLLSSAVLLVWYQTWAQWPHLLLGVRLDLLPALVLYCALFRSWKELFLVCGVGGWMFDSFSLNPLGMSTLALLLPSYGLYCYRKVILSDSLWVQALMGFILGVISPLLVCLVLTGVEPSPVFGTSLIWCFLVLGMTTAMAAPLVVLVMEYLMRLAPVPRSKVLHRGSHRPIETEL